MRDDLKPCPFCGSRETSTSYATNTEGVVSSRFVECEDCAAMGPAVDVDALAIAAWNRRAALQQGEAQDQGDANLGWFIGRARKDGFHTQADWLAEYERRATKPAEPGEVERLRKENVAVIEGRKAMRDRALAAEQALASVEAERAKDREVLETFASYQFPPSYSDKSLVGMVNAGDVRAARARLSSSKDQTPND